MQMKCHNRIVVNVSVDIYTHENGKLNYTRMANLVRVLSNLIHSGKEVVLVGSGALEMGMHKLKLKTSPIFIREKQAVAAVGQCELMYIYNKLFAEHNCIVGQVLLTKGIIEDDNVRKNIMHTFELLLQRGIIPIVDGNDTVAMDDNKNITYFSEEQNLSGIIGTLIQADMVVDLAELEKIYHIL